MHTLACLLPRCLAENEIQVVDDEWRQLPLEAENLPHDVCNASKPDQFWYKLLHHRDECGEQLFKALPKFALTALSMPFSNYDFNDGILHANQAAESKEVAALSFHHFPKCLVGCLNLCTPPRRLRYTKKMLMLLNCLVLLTENIVSS